MTIHFVIKFIKQIVFMTINTAKSCQVNHVFFPFVLSMNSSQSITRIVETGDRVRILVLGDRGVVRVYSWHATLLPVFINELNRARARSFICYVIKSHYEMHAPPLDSILMLK
jgi:hypothetical protein